MSTTATESYSLQVLTELGIEVKTTKYGGTVPELPEDQYEGLRASIAANGLYEPISINQSGDVLDGHHRLRDCRDLKVVQPRFVVKTFGSEVEERIFVREANLARRQLSTLQRAELALALKPDYAEKAKLNMSRGGSGVKVSQHYETFHTSERLAKVSQLSKGTFEKAEQLLLAEQQSPEQFGKLAEAARDNRITVNKAYLRMRKARALEKKKSELAQAAEKLSALLPDRVTLLNRDMREEIPEIPDGSVDLIVTDPPYTAGKLHLFESLAAFSSRKLRAGGSLVFYFGQFQLLEVAAIFLRYKGTLNWQWPIAVIHHGHTSRFHSLGIWPRWKPMFWFCKGEESRLTSYHHSDMYDLIESEAPNKCAHPWAQSPVEAEYLIRNLTIDENALVCDPFLGSGAFGISAARLNRFFIGLEIDKDTFEKARINMAQALARPQQQQQEQA